MKRLWKEVRYASLVPFKLEFTSLAHKNVLLFKTNKIIYKKNKFTIKHLLDLSINLPNNKLLTCNILLKLNI